MRAFRIALFIGLAAVLAAAEEAGDYDYEEEPVQPKKPIIAPVRGRSAPSLPGRANKIPPTPVKPSKAAPKPAEEPEQLTEEQEPEGGDEETAAAPGEEVTEPPKKTIKPIVRPFRSNDELLAILKRRRQQAQQHGTVVDRTTTHTPLSTEVPKVPVRNSNKANKPVRPSPKASDVPDSARRTPAPPSLRKTANRPAKTTQPEEEPQQEQEATSRAKFNRGSRRL